MTVNVTGGTGKGKDLASVLGTIIKSAPLYKGGTHHRFNIGAVALEDGCKLIIPDSAGNAFINTIIAGLIDKGYKCSDTESTDTLTSHMPESDILAIEIPLDGFTDFAIINLKKLVASKSVVLKKALGIEELPIERGETLLRFPWFIAPTDGREAETFAAYTMLIQKMCEMAKRQKRVVEKETSAENPKWVMRTFLLRLGFVGDEFKTARRILTANLDGDGAYRGGVRPGQ
jgi:hypothetical protein